MSPTDATVITRRPARSRLAAIALGAAALVGFALTPTEGWATPTDSIVGWSYAVARDGQWHRDVADPSQHAVVDGDVLGWTFGPIDAGTAPTPNAPADFRQLCPASDRAPSAGPRVRIAVVVDSSLAPVPAEEPVAVSCITVSRGTNANEALSQSGAAVRFDGVVLCAISDIPEEGCLNDAAAGSAQSPAASPRPSASVPLTPATTPATSLQPTATPEVNSGQSTAFTQTPRAWLLSGGLLLLAIGLAAATKRPRKARS